MEKRQERKERRVWLVLWIAVVLTAMYITNQSAGLPTVRFANGECVNIITEGDDGKEVERDCSTIDLKNDRYNYVHAASADEIAEIELARR